MSLKRSGGGNEEAGQGPPMNKVYSMCGPPAVKRGIEKFLPNGFAWICACITQFHSLMLIVRLPAYPRSVLLSLGTPLLAYESSLSACAPSLPPLSLCFCMGILCMDPSVSTERLILMSMDSTHSTHVPWIALLSMALLFVLSMAAFILSMLLISVVSATIRGP